MELKLDLPARRIKLTVCCQSYIQGTIQSSERCLTINSTYMMDTLNNYNVLKDVLSTACEIIKDIALDGVCTGV